MSERPDKIRIQDMIESCKRIIAFTKDIDKNEFIASNLVQDAVIRNIEILGEATSKISDEFKNTYSELEWHKIKGTRNRLVHDYFGVNLDT